jgi:hypothetical protein
VRPGGRHPAHQFPPRPQPAQFVGVKPLLQPRQQDVLLVADVLAQHLDQPGQPLGPARVVDAAALQRGDQLVDLLVLLLDPQGQRVAVRELPAQHRPEHGLLGERVAEHQPVDALQNLLLRDPGRGLQLVQQAVEPYVVAALAGQHAARAAELVEGLGGEGSVHAGLLPGS